MNTVNLQYILDHGPWLNQLNGHVCSRDVLPKNKPSNVRAYIVNTDRSDQPGEHWVAIFFYENNREAYYFDSYGLPPIHEEVLQFLDNNSNTWRFNHQQIQDVYSTTCGLYCLFTLDALAKGYDIQRYLQHHFYKTNFFKNDVKIQTWLKQNYGTMYNASKKQSKTVQCCKPKQNHHEMNKHFPHLLMLDKTL